MNSRRAAAFVVARWIATHGHLSEMLPDGPDRAFVQDLAYTTVRRFRALRSVLGKLVTKWPKGEMEALLLVGGAQILYMPDVPDFAAVNETVMAAKCCPNKSIAKVVNGVLRNLIRRREEFEAYLKSAPLAERESFPNGIVNRWVERYGEESAEKLCKWHNQPSETWLAYRPGTPEPFVKLERGRKVSDVEGYAEGAFVVQDPATAGAIELLDVQPGMKVLDFCAAPGGKSIQCAWRLGDPKNGARLVSQEVNPARRRRLVENLKRVGLDWVEAVAKVGEGELFDRVLADVPCSNTGVLRRRPDARWNWTKEHLAELVKLQSEIFLKAAAHVAHGGIIVYSTCSNEPEENEAQIEAFLASNPDFEEVGRLLSVPFESGRDGAFACALRRKS
jgi:16S rRNA (cytosine967-C5)-methyltransferase